MDRILYLTVSLHHLLTYAFPFYCEFVDPVGLTLLS